MKKLKIVFVSIVSLLILIEITTRYFGLHQYPLFIESTEFEYIHKPNQTTKIYGNKFSTNEYSMRSKSISTNDTSVILLIGDSVLNGGNTIDQEDLASTIVENELHKKLKKRIRVLNVSSYTWGPDNIYAYLKKYGTFNADLLIYICNSGDAYDPMTFERIVGVSDTHTKHNYSLGTIKLAEKVLNMIKDKLNKKVDAAKQKPHRLTTGFSHINDLANKLSIPLLIYIHPDTQEIDKKEYNEEGASIINFYKSKNRTVIKELYLGIKKDYYKDNIHFNATGQQFMSKELLAAILQNSRVDTF
ncbi:hypothetical protein [Spirosoma arcticum]